MARKNKQKEYDYYNLSVPQRLRIIFELYIQRHPTLGFKKGGQYMIHILQKEAENIIKREPDIEDFEEVRISAGTYIKKENGSLEKIDD